MDRENENRGVLDATAAEQPPQDPLTLQTLQSCLRFLQREAEAAGLVMTAHLIGTASLAALDESVPTRSRMAH